MMPDRQHDTPILSPAGFRTELARVSDQHGGGEVINVAIEQYAALWVEDAKKTVADEACAIAAEDRISVLERERDRLGLKVEQYQSQLDDRWAGVVSVVNDKVTENAALQARLATLTAALEKYGTHSYGGGCHLFVEFCVPEMGSGHHGQPHCTCGLQAAIDVAAEGPE